MKKLKKLLTILLFALPVIIRAESKEIPFTLEDRDRIMRTEQKIVSLQSEVNARFDAVDKRFEAVDKRFDQLFNFLWAIIGIFTTMMVAVFGFAFLDRRFISRIT